MPTASTVPKQLTPWKPGQSGNPAGRAKGSRNKLGEKFIEDLYADWQGHGIAAIAKVREERPQDYLKVVASILPKELYVKDTSLEDVSDDELLDMLDAIRGYMAAVGLSKSRSRRKPKAIEELN